MSGMDLVLREVLVFGPGEHTFDAADYPWAVEIRYVLKGGDADGGEDGYAIVELYGAQNTPPAVA